MTAYIRRTLDEIKIGGIQMKEFFTGAFIMALILVFIGFSNSPIMIGWMVFTGIGSVASWVYAIFKSSNSN